MPEGVLDEQVSLFLRVGQLLGGSPPDQIPMDQVRVNLRNSISTGKKLGVLFEPVGWFSQRGWAGPTFQIYFEQVMAGIAHLLVHARALTAIQEK